MKRYISILTVIIILLSVAGCKSDKKDPVNIIYSISDSVTAFDPQIAKSDSSILIAKNIFEGLIRLDENNSPYSEICTDFTVSQDGLTYTFKLKENLKWSDGTPLTSNDFRFGIERSLDSATGSDFASLLFSINNAESYYNGEVSVEELGIETPDESTLIFTLSQIDNGFLYALSTPAGAPCKKDFFEETRGKYGLEADKLISNGAFYLHSVKDSYIRLQKNENYVFAESVKADNLYIYTNEDSDKAESEFLNGNRDVIVYDGADIDKFTDSKNTVSAFADSVWGVAFNLNDEIGKNPDFRKMLYHSIDSSVVSKTLKDKYGIANGLILPSSDLNGTNYRSASTFGSFNFDLEKAEAHYQKFVKTIDGYMPKIDIIYEQNDDFKETVSTIPYKCQSSFDIYINPTALEKEEFDNRLSSSDFQLAFTSIRPHSAEASDMLIYFTDAENILGLKDDKFNSLVGNINSNSVEKAIQVIENCENYIIRDKTVFIPIAFENNYFISSKDIQNLKTKQSKSDIDFRFVTK